MEDLIYNIGLDFGTYQSKACIFHLHSTPAKHEFMLFEDEERKPTFFLPSRVFLMEDDTFNYGFTPKVEL